MNWDWSKKFDYLIEGPVREECVLDLVDINIDIYEVYLKPLLVPVSIRIVDGEGKEKMSRLVMPGGDMILNRNNLRYLKNVDALKPKRRENSIPGRPAPKNGIEATEWEPVFRVVGGMKILASSPEPGVKVAGTLSGKPVENILII